MMVVTAQADSNSSKSSNSSLKLTKGENVLVSNRSVSIIKPAVDPPLQAASGRTVVAREKRASSSLFGEVEIIGTFYNKGGCVPYAWSQGMQTRGYGVASKYPVQKEPTGFASTFEGKVGHIVVVEADLGDSLLVRDANFEYPFITRRIIPKTILKGYVR